MISQVCPEVQINKQLNDQESQEQAHIQAFPKIQLMNEEQQPKISSSTPPQTNLIIPSQLFQNIPFQKSPKEIQSTQSSQRTQQVLYARRKRAKFQQLQNQEKFPISSLNNLSQNQLGFNQLQIVKQTSNLDQNENHQNSLQIISQNEIKDHQQDHPIKQQELLKPQFSQNNNDESQDPIYHFLSYKNLIPKVKLKIEFICLKYTFYVGSECLINQGGPSSLTDNTAEFNQNLKGLQQNDCIGAKQITCKGNNEIVLSSDNCKSNTQFSIQKNSNNVIQSIYLEINFLIDSSKSFAGSSIYHVNNQNFPKNDYFAQWCDTTSTLYFRITTINANINSNSLTIQFQPDSATSYSTIVYGFVLAVQYICPQNCAKCDSNTCLQCSPNYQIINGICQKSCDNSCLTCSGPGQNQCITCNNNYYISDKNQYCVSSCDSNQYLDSSQSQKYCKTCMSNCQACSNSNSCQQCNTSFYYTNNQCAACFNTCYSCSGPANNQCTKCLNNYYISEKLLNQCDANCDLTQGQYIDQSNPNQKYCRKCITNCKTCSNSTSCQICMDYYYLNGNACSPCHNSCQNCSGPGINQCIICKQSTYFIQPDQDNQCVQSCALNNAYYVDQQTNPQQKYCRKCLSSCKTCSNGNKCDTCFDKNFLDINKQCQPCDSTCQSCTGSKNTDCSVYNKARTKNISQVNPESPEQQINKQQTDQEDQGQAKIYSLQQIQSVEEDQQPKIGSPSLPQGNQVISSLLFTKSLKEFQPTINQKLPYSRRKRTKFLQLQTQEKLTQNNNQL
ncbi:hypothetical protein ABPG73_013251 [Tetrahymena malaccensis]